MSEEEVSVDAYIRDALGRADRANHWYGVMWTQYLFLTVVGWTLSTLIPFGLVIVLSLPDKATQHWANLLLVFVSAISLTCLAVASIMRLKERAENDLRMRNRIRAAVSAYRLGLVDLPGLHRELTDAYRVEESEIRP
jgi:hypothetical protein